MILRWLNEAWPMGAKVLLMVAQANEANNATDETPAKVVLLRARGWRFCVQINHAAPMLCESSFS